jgi:hypothetical protein
MTAPGFTANEALYRSSTNYSGGLAAYARGDSVTPAFWKEIGHFLTSAAHVACRATCWGVGAAVGTTCTAETYGAAAPYCAAIVAAATSACSDAC